MIARRISGCTALLAAALCAVLLSPALTGCAHIANQWVEDGPAVTESSETPTSRDVIEKHSPAEQRHRQGETLCVSLEPGTVVHGPIYMEDPFVDKGAGREGLNKYHTGWEDCIALPYCIARYTLNWLFSPVSMVVTPPWTKMESDGEISKQILWYDHDAARATCSQPKAEPAEEPAPEPAPVQPAEQPAM